MMKRAEEQRARHDPDDREERFVRHEVLDGEDHRDRQDQQADHPQRLGRVAPVQGVVALRDERQRDEHADAGHGHDDPASERAEVEMAVEVEVLEHRSGEQTEAQRREAEQHRLERADPVRGARARPRAARESSVRRRRLHRARRRISGWPRGGSGMRKAKIASGIVGRASAKYAQRQPSRPPASAAMPPTIAGLSTAARRAAPGDGRVHARREPRSDTRPR